MCIYIYVYIYMYIYTYIYIYVFMYLCMYVCMYVCIMHSHMAAWTSYAGEVWEGEGRCRSMPRDLGEGKIISPNSPRPLPVIVVLWSGLRCQCGICTFVLAKHVK